METESPASSTPVQVKELHHAGRVAARLLSKFAPLTSAQRAWLSGFLEELLDLPGTTEAVAPANFLLANSSPGADIPHTRVFLTPEPTSAHVVTPNYSADNPFSARVAHVSPNNPHDPTLWRITLDVTGSGLVARPGATLGAIPTNDAEHVRDILTRFKGAGQQSVTTARGSGPAWRALLEECNLCRVTDSLLRLLAQNSHRNSEVAELRRLAASGEYSGSVLGVLRRFPGAKPTIGDFVAALAPLSPEVFPVASTSSKSLGQLEVIITRESDERRSIVERLMNGRLQIGEWLPIYLSQRPEANPPEDPSAPAILVAPGVTSAWAATFLAERAAARALGRNWIFTCPPPNDSEVLYADLLASWQSNRTLTRLDISTPEELIQKLTQQGEMIQAWLFDQSYLYLFGSPGECRQLVASMSAILAARLKTSPEEADARLSEMRSKGFLRVVSSE
jgi:sulfite reductase (NADPH) flavoprotein alpha-component